MDMHLAEILCCNIFEGKQQYELRNNSWQAESCANLHMGWAFIFEFYPERKRGVKSKNIKAQSTCKFAQLYACHKLFRF